MSTHNIGFYEDLTKIIFELSSNTHLISSAWAIPELVMGVGCAPAIYFNGWGVWQSL